MFKDGEVRVLLSIIIPVYKTEATLNECVDSVLREAPAECEVILVDDGSPDKCPWICDEYAKSDNRIKVIHQQNKGLSGARNAGLREAQGDFIFFLDSDDYLTERYFSKLTVQTADLVISNYCAFYSDKTPDIYGKFESHLYSDMQDFLNNFHQYFPTVFNFAWGKIYRADIIRNNHLWFREDVSMVEDVLFNMAYYRCCNSVYVCTDSVVRYRQTVNTLSKRYNENLFAWYKESYLKIEKLLTDFNVFTEENKKHYYGQFLGNVGECLAGVFRNGKDKQAFSSVLNDEMVKEIVLKQNPQTFRRKWFVWVVKSGDYRNYLWYSHIIRFMARVKRGLKQWV